MLRPAREGVPGKSPRMPSVVSRLREPKPTKRTRAGTCLVVPGLVRAPFRRLPTRAPRQAVLRASFWLAPCVLISLEPFGSLEEEDQDALFSMRPTDFCHLND